MTRYVPDRHHRRSIRLKGYDYTQPGAYFVTVCTYNRALLFGSVVDGGMQLNEPGRIAEQCWRDIPVHFSHVESDAFVIMPNHVHGIIWIVNNEDDGIVGARHAVPLHARPQHIPTVEQFGKPVTGSIPTIVRAFKSAVTKRINALRNTPGAPIWQRNYYEHIIRNERALDAIRRYIAENPARWHLDRYNPAATGTDPQARDLCRLLKEDARAHPRGGGKTLNPNHGRGAAPQRPYEDNQPHDPESQP